MKEENPLVYSGELKKKNKYFMKQVRFFVLTRDGRVDYFKDKILLRGSIRLAKDSKVVKLGKDRFEIQTK